MYSSSNILIIMAPLPTQIIMFLSARFGPGKILEDICTIVGSAQKILLNLIESYWFIIFKRGTCPTPPKKILEDICTIVGSAQKILLNLIESYWFIIFKRGTCPTPPQKKS